MPQLHDKVEFEILFTCYDANTDSEIADEPYTSITSEAFSDFRQLARNGGPIVYSTLHELFAPAGEALRNSHMSEVRNFIR